MGKANVAPDLQPLLEQLRIALEMSDKSIKDDLQRTRNDLLNLTKENRGELNTAIVQLSQQFVQDAKANRDELSAALSKLNQQINLDSKANRDEIAQSLKTFSDTVSGRLQELISTQQNQFEVLRASIEDKLGKIQKDNSEKLEQMRITVDEKLHDTLEKRLGDSFKIVSERLELVQKGLGEMQSLANGVGDLKRVLTNVKMRGVLGEIQLESLLEQLLTPEQYEKNFKPNPRRDEIVEFAIRLPGRDEDNQSVFLPIDAKFPIEDYQRLLDAFEVADLVAIDAAQKNMAAIIKSCARDIRDKYIKPPMTTDFALLFLPFEGLYAEVLRNPGLFETVQREYHVIITGPTTLAAILNSLQLGFRTLAIEKRSSEVWKLLSAIKMDFGKFGDILEKTQKKLQEAGNVIEKASHRSKQIQRRLNKVQDLPAEETKDILLELDDIEVVEAVDDNE
ncbi:MAG: DNA recombination protein RmuC [Candidatus Cloacimonetes bacterium HGW-Cloacimonetes-1]|nr:MAG: DNA recombination protein RmuC [Candidatus Cloacimonetes bacterium HGW-Cloacimonetes-1]